MNKLNKDIISENLPKNRVNIDVYEEIDSTNDEAKRINLTNEFHLIVSESQSKGRGRQGKIWSSPNSGNIYMTLFTDKDLSFAPISLITGLICKKSISNLNKKIDIKLKWPNDILFQNKKVGGILVEKENVNSNLRTIIGIGINLDIQKKESWWGDLSMFNLKKQRNELISEIISNLIEFVDKKPSNWIDNWRKNCMHIDKEIEIYSDGKKISAIFKDINLEGHAIIKTDKGNEVFKSGQINLKGIY